MKKRTLFGSALLAMTIHCAAETKQALTLHMASGANIVYYLDTQPSIGFKGQTMTVTVANESSDIPMQDVDYWEIGIAEFSGITAPAAMAPQPEITVYGNSLTIHNDAAKDIAVYNMRGQIVGASNDNDARFTLSQGIYVIKVENDTYKIAIR